MPCATYLFRDTGDAKAAQAEASRGFDLALELRREDQLFVEGRCALGPTASPGNRTRQADR